MLFNSYEFIFGFLPITLTLYFLLARSKFTGISTSVLIVASLFFYWVWKPAYILILLASIVFNFYLGKTLQKGGKKGLLIIGISANLLLLGTYKYTAFIIENLSLLTQSDWRVPNIVLPLAISFFTFQQIAYLVDSHKGIVNRPTFKQYLLFVTFFPQLIAGPIVHYKEMIPQFADPKTKALSADNVATGLFLFTIGLAKKVIIADTLAVWVNQFYASGDTPGVYLAWIISLSYTFQLYFDFSGYMDMAMGIAKILNIKLPNNFNSPYKAKNIQDFWRRWHITLGRFLRDYVYVPLGGNRQGVTRMCISILAVFILGGIWHGAGWTFIFWGMLHGLAVIVVQIWSRIGIKLSSKVATLITFLFVHLTWVFFRAPAMGPAITMIKSLLGINGTGEGTLFTQLNQYQLVKNFKLEVPITLTILFIAFGICFSAKNSHDLAKNFKPTTTVAMLVLIAFWSCLILINSQAMSFIYFNF